MGVKEPAMMNLEQIAKLSGVSRSTVSRVINNDPNVSTFTRQNVLHFVNLAHYVPNATARSLAVGRTHVIGLIVPIGVSTIFTDPNFCTLVQGVSSACSAHDHTVMLWLADPEHECEQVRQLMYSCSIDGVIVASPLVNDVIVQTLMHGNLPFVLVGRPSAAAKISYVDVDHGRGAHDAVRHLLRQGHRRIATITGPQTMSTGVERLAGYQGALREHGLRINPNLIVDGGFTEAEGYWAMQQLLPQRPEAVFAANDAMALGALRAIRDAGLRVPQDISLVGFDDIPLVALTDPALTTVRQPLHGVGRVAVESLIELIDQPQAAPRQTLLPTELVIRSSCGEMIN
jgi:LacI family transcriptional regulator